VRVLVVHNYYQQPGGEDQVFAAEAHLLESRGHEVGRYVLHNDQIVELSRLRLGVATVWNGSSYRSLRDCVRIKRPDVVHFHNTFPLVSPAAYYAAKAEHLPVVQTLHNYRLLCPAATFYRNGGTCEDCLGKFTPYSGIVHACYRGSRAATGAVAAMLTVHRTIGTWKRQVDVYVALSAFASRKFVEGGLPAQKIVVKPNFLHPDPGAGDGSGRFALFAGRLTPEKGLHTLIESWRQITCRLPLKIVGDGPLAESVSQAARDIPGVEWLGRQPQHKAMELMRAAVILIVPSVWYECFPMTVVEAFASGLPVIASNIGSLSSIIEDGRTGLHFDPGNADDLARKVTWVLDNPNEITRMRWTARSEYQTKYSADRNYSMLVDIYRRAVASAAGKEWKSDRHKSPWGSTAAEPAASQPRSNS
jgi:glycosyltransferase involved in cell wall biosynthesis